MKYNEWMSLMITAVLLVAVLYVGYDQYQQYRAKQQAEEILKGFGRLYGNPYIP